MSNKQVVYSGPGVLGILGVAFVVLKLTGFINWSWWWVTIPFWGPFALFIVILLIIGVIGIFKVCLKGLK